MNVPTQVRNAADRYGQVFFLGKSSLEVYTMADNVDQSRSMLLTDAHLVTQWAIKHVPELRQDKDSR